MLLDYLNVITINFALRAVSWILRNLLRSLLMVVQEVNLVVSELDASTFLGSKRCLAMTVRLHFALISNGHVLLFVSYIIISVIVSLEVLWSNLTWILVVACSSLVVCLHRVALILHLHGLPYISL